MGGRNNRIRLRNYRNKNACIHSIIFRIKNTRFHFQLFKQYILYVHLEFCLYRYYLQNAI